MTHAYKFGIEEEYFLAECESGHSPARDVAEAFHAAAKDTLNVAEHEPLVGQIEVSTEPGTDLDQAADTLRSFCRKLADLAAEHGLDLFAAGSQPLAFAERQHATSSPRYERLGGELKLIAPQAAVSAMHVHVEVPDADKRIELINRLMPFLPLFLALSVSSPFWEGHNSGLQGYRLTAFSQWPRVGLPGWFSGTEQYASYIERLKTAGFVEDGSFVWSHIRPSAHYPTIEMRICDSCTRVTDAVAIAALYRALLSAIIRRPDVNAGFGPVEHALCGINLWRAQQAGVSASLVDCFSDRILGVSEMLDETLELVGRDFDDLKMGEWPRRLKNIVSSGASADRQLTSYETSGANGGEAALQAVIRELAHETVNH